MSLSIELNRLANNLVVSRKVSAPQRITAHNNALIVGLPFFRAKGVPELRRDDE